MGRTRTGQVRWRNGKATARITLGTKRPTFPLPTCATDDEANARATLLAELADKLTRAEQLEHAPLLLRKAAIAAPAELAAVVRLVEVAAEGKLARERHKRATFADIAKEWTGGELARRYPDHVKRKATAGDDAIQCANYINPLVGERRIVDFSLDDADMVMASLPAHLSSASRRHVAQVMHRVLSLAVFPLRVLERSPLPRGWLPKIGPRKAKPYLYPDEERRLLACDGTDGRAAIPFRRRFAYGFLAREGPRKSEGRAFRFDLERGAVTLDENKTDDPRAWALGADVVEALRLVVEIHGPGEIEAIFAEMGSLRGDQFRRDLVVAGVERAELFAKSPARKPIDVHGLRATFVTLALAAGRSEAWVTDRTGHTSSAMVHRYRRAARTAGELGLGWLTPLHEALPELRAAAAEKARRPADGARAGARRADLGRRGRRRRPVASPDARHLASKSGVVKATAGSNPALSAETDTPARRARR